MPDVQTTFPDLQNFRRVKALTQNQRKIISLINCQLTQTQIADRLRFSRAYVNQVVKRLEAINLIKRVNTQKAPAGTRAYNYFYEVAAEAMVPDQPFTACRVHNIRKKFRILQQSGPIAADKRASWVKSWKMRGWQAQKFWYPGKAGLPSVTIDVNPKTIVAYVDKGQFIPAHDIEQAKQIAWYALVNAKDLFIQQQERFGIHLGVEVVGEDIAKIHMGFLFDERSPIAQEHTQLEGWWIDKSPAENLGPHIREIETDQEHYEAFPLDEGIKGIKKLPETVRASTQEAMKEFMPEAMQAFEKQFGPMTKEIHTVMAHIQSGMSVDSRLNQLILMFGTVLEQQHQILERMNNTP